MSPIITGVCGVPVHRFRSVRTSTHLTIYLPGPLIPRQIVGARWRMHLVYTLWPSSHPVTSYTLRASQWTEFCLMVPIYVRHPTTSPIRITTSTTSCKQPIDKIISFLRESIAHSRWWRCSPENPPTHIDAVKALDRCSGELSSVERGGSRCDRPERSEGSWSTLPRFSAHTGEAFTWACRDFESAQAI
jgi:hypothetical protein